MNKKYVLLVILVFGIITITGCTTNDTNNGNDTGAGTIEGEEIMNDKCTQCHGLGTIENKKMDESEWRTTIDSMIQRGADLTDDEIDTLANYLAENY